MNLRKTTSRLIAGASIALLASFGTVAANAHDVLTGSSPENGATVKSSPKELSMTFSAELQANPVPDAETAALSVDGTKVPVTATTKGNTVTVVPDQKLPNGDYTLAVRVISSDSHPVSESVAFTIAAPEASSAPASSAPASEAPAAQPSETPADEPVQNLGASMNPIVWVIIAVVVAGGLVAVLVNFARNNKK